MRTSRLSLRSFEEPPYPDQSILRMALSPEEKDLLVKLDAKNKYFLESHIPAIVWARKHNGYRIQDMIDRHYFDVTNLIQKYMPTDPLLKTITDPALVDSYLTTIFNWYPKTQSLVAIKEGTREIIGVLIGRLVIEPEWFELVSQIQFVTKKDKYAYLKKGKTDASDGKKIKPGGKGPRTSRLSKRGSKTLPEATKTAPTPSKAGSRKSMGAKKGGRKSMGAGGRKSMGGKGGRKSMGAKGGRKSVGGGSRKSITRGGKSGRKSIHKERKPGDWKVPRPIDKVPEEIVPIVQATVFDDDNSVYPGELQLLHSFKKKLSDRIQIWKMIRQKMYYRVYLMAVSPKYQRMEVDSTLVESLKTMCTSFNVSAIAGIMTTYDSQNAFYKAGGLLVYEILYKNYPAFANPDPKSYDQSAAIVYLETPLPPSSQDSTGNKDAKKSRGKS